MKAIKIDICNWYVPQIIIFLKKTLKGNEGIGGCVGGASPVAAWEGRLSARLGTTIF